MWAWAPDEQGSRTALEELLDSAGPDPLRYAQVHSGNVLPDALHPRRVLYLSRRTQGRWIAELQRAQYAGLYDDAVVSVRLT